MAEIAVGCASAHQVASVPAARGLQPPPERLVAEGTIGDYVYLPVTLHGKGVTLILDVGFDDSLFLADSLLPWVGLSVSDWAVDTLYIGTAVERNIKFWPGTINWGMAPPGMPPLIGELGAHVLAHYDLLLDGPGRRVRLYTPVATRETSAARQPATVLLPAVRPGWLPAGLTPADCVPMTAKRGKGAEPYAVTFALQANGHGLNALFDSGARQTTMNFVAADLLGIRLAGPRVHLLPPDSAKTYPAVGAQKAYSVTGITLKASGRSLPAFPIVIEKIPSPDSTSPQLLLGMDAFRDRLLWISYSTRQVCWTEPLPAQGTRP